MTSNVDVTKSFFIYVIGNIQIYSKVLFKRFSQALRNFVIVAVTRCNPHRVKACVQPHICTYTPSISVSDRHMVEGWLFHPDSDPKHTSKLVLEWIKNDRIKPLEWPSQSPNLNPDGNLWGLFKSQVYARKPTSLNNLY